MLRLPDNPTKAELKELLHRVDVFERQQKATENLLSFIDWTMPKFIQAEIHRRVCFELDKFVDDVVNQRSPRLALIMPPRHTKSEMVSRRLPAFALGKYPWLRFAGTSHSMTLAQKMNRDVQRIMMDNSYKQIFDSRLNEKNVRTMQNQAVRNSDEFEVTGYESSFKAAGAGQAIAGYGFHIVGIDDPFGNRKDANSKTVQTNRIDWLQDDIEPRLEKGGGILITHTRWHMNDLIGWIKENQAHEWRILEYPAIAIEDSDWRKKGEALQPERYGLDFLQRRQRLNPIGFESLYQGNPTLATGKVFMQELMRQDYMRNFPRCDYRIVFADTAQKDLDGNDWTVFQIWGFHSATHTAFMLDEYRERLQYPDLKKAAIMFHMKHSENTFHGKIRNWEIEDKSSGTSLIQDLKRPQKLDDGSFIRIPVNAYSLPRGSKTDRALDVVGYLNSCVFPKDAPWILDYMAELLAFPSGTYDDRVDPTVMALDKFFNLSSKNRKQIPKPFGKKKLIGA